MNCFLCKDTGLIGLSEPIKCPRCNQNVIHSNDEVQIESTQQKKNIILDATLLTALMTCGRFTDLRFNQRLVSSNGKSNSLECGSIVHKVLETYYRARINKHSHRDAIGHGMVAGELYIKGCPHCTEFQPTVEIPKPSCHHPIDEYPGVKNTPPDNTKIGNTLIIGWKWALETCEQYFDHYQNDFWIPLEVETVKREILYEDDEIRIMWKAKLDVIMDTNKGIWPMDHKTMKQRRDTLSLNNQFTGQCILLKSRNVVINKIGFQTTLKPEEKFIRDLKSYSADRLIEWQSQILPYWAYKLIEYTEMDYWPPNYTHCEGKFGPCIFNEVCQGDRNMRSEMLQKEFVVGKEWDIDNVEE